MRISQKPRKFAIMIMLAVFLMAQAGIAAAALSTVGVIWNVPTTVYNNYSPNSVSATVYNNVSSNVYATVYASVYSYATGTTTPITSPVITKGYIYGSGQTFAVPMTNFVAGSQYRVDLAVYSATYANLSTPLSSWNKQNSSSTAFLLNNYSGGGSYGSSSGGGGGSSSSSSSSTTTTSTTVAASTGGTVSGQGASISIPAGALASDVKVTITNVANTSGLNLETGSKYVSDVLEIIKNITGNFSKPVTITLNFDKSKVDTTQYDVKICFYDETNDKWVPLDNISVDTTAGKVSGDVTHFTKFAAIAFAKAVVPVVPAVLSDINGNWAEANIQKLVDTGAITGYPDGTFKPNKTITRAEFVSVLVKAFNVAPGSKTFADTTNHWAKDAIGAAAAAGIVNGISATSFAPDANITREQMAVMIAKAANLTTTTGSKTFTDGSGIATWAKTSVDAAAAKGVISGYPDGSFRPQANANRAEAATMIIKALGK